MEDTQKGNLINHDQAAHDKHLCMMVQNRQMKTVAELSKNPQYVCRACGRVAARAENLCEPVSM